MAKLVFGMNQSLDGYVDHTAFAPGPTLFRHFIEEAQRQAGSVYGRKMYEIMRYFDDDHPDWDADRRAFAAAWRKPARWSVLTLRATMAVVAVGSLLGMWEHLQGNRGFALEVHPELGGLDLLRSSLTGADPLLARRERTRRTAAEHAGDGNDGDPASQPSRVSCSCHSCPSGEWLRCQHGISRPPDVKQF